jgi:hypothetical protein
MKLKIFKKEKVFRKGGFHINPDLWWEAVLSISFLLILASFIFGFFLLRNLSKEPVVAEIAGQAKTIKKERINSALRYFAEKKRRSLEIANSPSPIVDPSR